MEIERLTRWNKNKCAELMAYDPDEWKEFINSLDTVDWAHIITAIETLAEYEDTGLTPEEIENLKEQRDFWQNEARIWAAMLGEIKMAEAAKKEVHNEHLCLLRSNHTGRQTNLLEM